MRFGIAAIAALTLFFALPGYATEASHDDILVVVDFKGNAFLNDRPFTDVYSELADTIAHAKQPRLFVWIDKNAAFEHVSTVLGVAENAGLKTAIFNLPDKPVHTIALIPMPGTSKPYKIEFGVPDPDNPNNIVLKIDFDGTISHSGTRLDPAALGSTFRQAGKLKQSIYICPNRLSKFMSLGRLLTDAVITGADTTIVNGACR